MNKLIPRLAPAGRPMAALAGLAAMAAAGLATAAPAGAVPVYALPTGGHAVSDSTTVNYDYTGSEQTFTVPAGVTSIDVVATGAAGGSGSTPTSGGTGGSGGEGEQVSGTLAVIPGNTLYVEVGGVGADGTTSAGGTGGFNGGADGAGTSHTGGGGGGGASDVRTIISSGGGSLASRLIVAGGGGGGGGGGDCSGSSGGAGGTSAATAGDGGNCSPGVEHGGTGGAVGTDSAGGAGGTGGADGTGTGTVGADGGAGSQGAGGASATIGSGGGGGGGAISTVPHWGAGGGGGAGSSFATTDDGPTTDAAEVSITYSTPPPVGTSDLKVFLKHQGVLQHHRLGSYGIWVTNTGTAATTNAHPIVVTLDTGRGIVVAQGGRGTDWQCHKQVRATTCTRAAPLGAGNRTMITVSVWVNARAGKTRHATATVSPSDTTAADNTSTDKAIIRKH
jgi:hypothetical protein